MAAKRDRKVLNITMDQRVLKEMRAHCDRERLTYSGYIEDLVIADLAKEKTLKTPK